MRFFKIFPIWGLHFVPDPAKSALHRREFLAKNITSSGKEASLWHGR
jgi:hypothetical protein